MFVLLLSVIALTVLITASDYHFKPFVNDINLDITYKFNNSHECKSMFDGDCGVYFSPGIGILVISLSNTWCT
jgi:hypothetical protein